MKHTLADFRMRDGRAALPDHPDRPGLFVFGYDGDPEESPVSQIHEWEHFSIEFFFWGQGELRDHNGLHRIRPGSVVVRRSGMPQRYVLSGEPRYGKAYMCLNDWAGDILLAMGVVHPTRTAWYCRDVLPALHLHSRLIEDLKRPEERQPRGVHLWHRVLEILDLLCQEDDLGGGDPLAAAAARLNNDIRAELDLEGLAADSGMAYNTFRRRFRERFNTAPATWRHRARMRQAQALLHERTVAGVAALLGYATPFAFSNQFKAATGMSPQEWKRRMVRE